MTQQRFPLVCQVTLQGVGSPQVYTNLEEHLVRQRAATLLAVAAWLRREAEDADCDCAACSTRFQIAAELDRAAAEALDA